MARYPNWLRKIMLLCAMSAFALLGTQCGTFEINGQLVTATLTRSTATYTPSAPPNTSTPTSSATPITTATATLNNAQPTNDATVGPISNQLGVPLLADAQIIVDIDSHLIYRSQTTLSAARIFYQAEMQANGWKLTKDDHSETQAVLTFSKENETITVTLKTDALGLLLDIKR